jgi:hypothetical protein
MARPLGMQACRGGVERNEVGMLGEEWGGNGSNLEQEGWRGGRKIMSLRRE